jgi:hypothetical protein
MSRRYITVEEQRLIIERANGRCEYCQSLLAYAVQPFAVDHITAVSQGGITTLENLALACGGCNGHKYDKDAAIDPITGQLASLYHPRQQNWSDHFGWNDQFTEVIGFTPTGRASVAALNLNRPGLINMRKLLLLAGEHPPAL